MSLCQVTSLIVIPCLSLILTAPTRPQTSKSADSTQQQPAASPHEPTAADISSKETVASAILRTVEFQEYEVRSIAETMPEDKYGFRPGANAFADTAPEAGPKALRTFAEQIKHVACANFAFAAELDGKQPPSGCDQGGPSPARTRAELLTYLRDSFAAIKQ